MPDLAFYFYSQSRGWKHAKSLVEVIEPGARSPAWLAAVVKADLGDLRPGVATYA